MCSYAIGDVEVRRHSRGELFRDIKNFHVCFLRMPGEDVEYPVRRNRVDERRYALGLRPELPMISPDSSRSRSPTTTTECVLPFVSTMRCRLLNEPPEVRIAPNVWAT